MNDRGKTCAPDGSKTPSGLQGDARFRQTTKEGSKDFNDIARYYRIAAAPGHKANQNAQLLISQALADSPDSRESNGRRC